MKEQYSSCFIILYICRMIKCDPFIKPLFSFLLSTAGYLFNLFVLFPYIVGEDGMGRDNTQESDAIAALYFSIITLLILLGGWLLLSMFLARMAKWPMWPCVVSLLLVVIGGFIAIRNI